MKFLAEFGVLRKDSNRYVDTMKRRIAMISDHASPLADPGSVDSGGQNVYVAQISRRLAAMGYLVDVFTRHDNPLQPEIYKWEKGLRVIHVPAGPAEFKPKEELIDYMPEFAAYLVNFINRQPYRYDLVHAHFWMSALLAMEVKQALGIPFVVTFHALGRVRRQHQGSSDRFPDLRFDIEEKTVEEAEMIIAECPQDKQDLIDLYQAAPEKLKIIPCGFDPAEMWPMDKALARLALGIPADERVVLQLGRIVKRKGIDNAIRGFSRLVNKHHIPARMLIVGGDSEDADPKYTPEIGRLKRIAAKEGVARKVQFTGRKPRHILKYYFSAADIFISTPWYEPFGITPVESMACGTPVIGSNVGGIKYSVQDGVTGFLVDPKDPDALGERLAFLYRNPNVLQTMSKSAVDRANGCFTWDTVSGSISELYETVLLNRPLLVEDQAEERLRFEQKLVQDAFDNALEVMRLSRQTLGDNVVEAASTIGNCILRGGKVMVCGNGGSAAESQHFTAELVGRYSVNGRKGLPVLSLTADTSFLTAWANDTGYEHVFSRQVESYGSSGDVLLGLSTSGNSENLVEAFKIARQMEIYCLALLGGDGGKLLQYADQAIIVPSLIGQRIQEVQLFLLHTVAELVEQKIRPEPINGSSVRGDTAVLVDLFLPGEFENE